MTLSCILSEIKQDIAAFFSYATSTRRPLPEFRHTISQGKTKMVGLQDGGKSLRICLAVSIQYTNVSDRQIASHSTTA